MLTPNQKITFDLSFLNEMDTLNSLLIKSKVKLTGLIPYCLKFKVHFYFFAYSLSIKYYSMIKMLTVYLNPTCT